jgi:hypothetical protein
MKERSERMSGAKRVFDRVVSKPIAGFDYPFLCVNGNSHQWQRTYKDALTWTSNNTGTNAPEGAPLLKEYRCFCGAIKQAY